jgi:RNA polymerase sigma-70 factor (ECF subfamily)
MAISSGTRTPFRGFLAERNRQATAWGMGRMSSLEAQDIANPNDQSNVDFERGLITLIPHLRAFAIVLCRNRELAEDIAQEALARAWRARTSFQPGSNLRAWLFTILRNEFLTYRRRAWRQTPWDDEAVASTPVSASQYWSSELSDIGRALYGLSIEQREALILVTVSGFSYEEAARISECSIGTVKSRVFRARAALATMLEENKPLPERPPTPGAIGLDEILAYTLEQSNRTVSLAKNSGP